MSLKDLAQQMKARGRNGDTELIHMTKGEVAGLQQLAEAAGGTLTRNPDTGLPEASFLQQLLPTIVGAGVGFMTMNPYAGAAAGAAVGGMQNKDDPLMGAVMGGLGGYGGAGFGAGLGTAGTAAAGAAATPSAEIAASQALADTARTSMGASASGLPFTGAEADVIRNQAMGAEYLKATDAFKAQPFFDRAGQGIGALGDAGGRTAFMGEMGGLGGLAKSGAMGAAPLLMPVGNRGPSGVPAEEEDTEDLFGRYEYVANPTGGVRPAGAPLTSEARYFDPEFRPRFTAAQGGAVKKSGDGRAAGATPSYYYTSREMQNNEGFAMGGITNLAEGGFVVPADVVSMAGEGNTEAGYERIRRTLPGATPIKGKDGGQADTVKATIEGKQPARVAHGEMYLPPETVKKAGGAKKLYAMMDKVRKQATGSTKQIKPVKALA